MPGVAEPRVSRSGARLGALAGVVGRVQRGVRDRIVPLDAVAGAVPRGGRVLELGCGDGLVLQRLVGLAAEVVGVDVDARKLEVARARLGGAGGVRLLEADALAFLAADAGGWDAVLLVDALSSFAPGDQDRLLDAALRAVRPGGALVLKVIDVRPRWKAALSRALSGVVYRVLGMSLSASQRFTYRASEELRARLDAAGAATELRHLHRELRHPIPHVLLVARAGAR